jgi:hypothetical protein
MSVVATLELFNSDEHGVECFATAISSFQNFTMDRKLISGSALDLQRNRISFVYDDYFIIICRTNRNDSCVKIDLTARSSGISSFSFSISFLSFLSTFCD